MGKRSEARRIKPIPCQPAYEEPGKDEERFRIIVENAFELIWETDTDWKYTYLSPKVFDFLGYHPEELVCRKTVFDLFFPEDLERMHETLAELIRKKELFRHFPKRYRHKDGRPVWILCSGIPMLDSKGKLLGFRGADIDITRQKQMEQELQESEEGYRTAIECSNDGVAIYKGEELLYVNQKFVEIFGYEDPRQVIGKPI